jgi:hypothetical protein
MISKAPVFEKIYQDYLARVAGLDLTNKQDILGIRVEGQTTTIPFFNETFSVFPRKIEDHQGRRPPHSVCVILCQYLLLGPDAPDEDRQLKKEIFTLLNPRPRRSDRRTCLSRYSWPFFVEQDVEPTQKMT